MDDARHLLQCLTVAVRPLRVEELAEILALDFQATGEQRTGIPKLMEDWRWDDQDEAVPSTCSSLINIVHDGRSPVVQLSHLSVKEYLTSPRLSQTHGNISRFYIDLDVAHTILAQGCLGTLLRLDEHAGAKQAKQFPLLEYAAHRWTDHARFGKVSSRIRDGVYDLFDSSKPHFPACRRVHAMDENWLGFTRQPQRLDHGGSLLYYAAFCGLYDLVEHLIVEHPEQVNGGGSRIPLLAALYNRHFRVANLLHEHGAVLDVRGQFTRTPLHTASMYGRVDIMRWLLDHGADTNVRNGDRWTPLHLAAHNTQFEAVHAVQVLLEHNAAVNSQNDEGKTPLYEALFYPGTSREGEVVVNIARRLLEHGADTNIRDRCQSTPLHRASSKGWVEVTRLLLNYGANVDEKDEEGRTPFQMASSKGYDKVENLLLEHGAVSQP